MNFTRRTKIIACAAMAGGAILSLGVELVSNAQGALTLRPMAPLMVPKKIVIDLDKATPLKLPTPKFDLKVTQFVTPDGKEGWEVKLPDGRPIATPAYWNGMVFVGGGYGSYAFYAFDAETGKLNWKYQTADDGPTAAVVEDGYCAFNTESCTVYVLNAKTGKLVWQEWLGDPLMSQPAIANGRLYMAYPYSAQRKVSNPVQESRVDRSKYPYNLLCADLKTGKHFWTAPITADAISAPIIDKGKVLLSCQDGTSFCFDSVTGKRNWMKENAGTSAPLATNSGVIFTRRENKGKKAFENVESVDAIKGATNMDFSATARTAPYLMAPPSLMGATNGTMHSLDSSVGFAAPPPAAQLEKAAIPVNSVVGGWAYQGSRMAARGDHFYNSNGRQINSIQKNGADDWNAIAKGKNISDDQQIFSPPALGDKNMYIASATGNLLSIEQKGGTVLFNYATQQPITFQPALANGNVYVGTTNGLLLCLKTKSKDADGWSAWGGNPQHNKH